MRNWILYLGVSVFGATCIAGSMTVQESSEWDSFLLSRTSLVVGGVFVVVGTAGLFFGKPMAFIPSIDSGRQQGIILGLLITLFSGIGAIYLAVAYVLHLDAPEWKDHTGYAWWIGWVFFAQTVWFFLAGIVLMKQAYKSREIE